MPSLNIDELEQREELPYQRYHLVGHVLAMRAADEQRALLEPHLGWIPVWEVAEVV